MNKPYIKVSLKREGLETGCKGLQFRVPTHNLVSVRFEGILLYADYKNASGESWTKRIDHHVVPEWQKEIMRQKLSKE